MKGLEQSMDASGAHAEAQVSAAVWAADMTWRAAPHEPRLSHMKGPCDVDTTWTGVPVLGDGVGVGALECERAERQDAPPALVF